MKEAPAELKNYQQPQSSQLENPHVLKSTGFHTRPDFLTHFKSFRVPQDFFQVSMKNNPNFRDIIWNVEENELLYMKYSTYIVSCFPCYIPCFITENRLPLGQYRETNSADSIHLNASRIYCLTKICALY